MRLWAWFLCCLVVTTRAENRTTTLDSTAPPSAGDELELTNNGKAKDEVRIQHSTDLDSVADANATSSLESRVDAVQNSSSSTTASTMTPYVNTSSSMYGFVGAWLDDGLRSDEEQENVTSVFSVLNKARHHDEAIDNNSTESSKQSTDTEFHHGYLDDVNSPASHELRLHHSGRENFVSNTTESQSFTNNVLQEPTILEKRSNETDDEALGDNRIDDVEATFEYVNASDVIPSNEIRSDKSDRVLIHEVTVSEAPTVHSLSGVLPTPKADERVGNDEGIASFVTHSASQEDEDPTTPSVADTFAGFGEEKAGNDDFGAATTLLSTTLSDSDEKAGFDGTDDLRVHAVFDEDSDNASSLTFVPTKIHNNTEGTVLDLNEEERRSGDIGVTKKQDRGSISNNQATPPSVSTGAASVTRSGDESTDGTSTSVHQDPLPTVLFDSDRFGDDQIDSAITAVASNETKLSQNRFHEGLILGNESAPFFDFADFDSHFLDFNITGRSMRQGREFASANPGVCLAFPYPCAPGEACKIVEKAILCYTEKDACPIDLYPCEPDESCRIVDGEPVCYPNLNVCVADPSPCRAEDACRVVKNKTACYHNHCLDVTCSDHGICREQFYGYRCECNPGYGGEKCEKELPRNAGPCEPNPCKGDCICQDSCRHELGYYCASAGGFTGKNCTVPIPRVDCGPKGVTIDISENLYRELDQGLGNTFFYVAPNVESKSKCEAITTRSGFRITIPMPFVRRCLTLSKRADGKSLVVANSVIADRRSDQFSVATPIVDFQCTYERQYQLVTSLKPVITKPLRREGYGSFTPKIQLCKISNCPYECPPELSVAKGAVYTIGESIYFSASVLPTAAFNEYVVVVNRMAISCDETGAFTRTELLLLDDGCSVDQTLPVTVSAGRTACVSIQTPRSPCATFYIHLELAICRDTELVSCGSSGSVVRCVSSRRIVRSVHRLGEEKFVEAQFGPITVIAGKAGIAEVELYPGASNTSFKFTTHGRNPVSRQPKTELSIVFNIAIPCFFVVLCTALLCLVCCRKSNRLARSLRIVNFRGFRQLNSGGYVSGTEFHGPSNAKLCSCDPGFIVCQCRSKTEYDSTKLQSVGTKSEICPCRCSDGRACVCSPCCQLCSCKPSLCPCGCGSTCKCAPSCKLCSCSFSGCPCGNVDRLSCKCKPPCQLCLCQKSVCPCGCAFGSACNCQPPCHLCCCKCQCRCNLNACSCVSECDCRLRCTCSCNKSCKCCN